MSDNSKQRARGGTGLSVAGIGHRFGDRAVVDDVSFDIPAGQVHCLMGPSGCGKSTTLRLIAGLLPLASGKITLNGETLSGDGVHIACEKRRIGLMFQDLALFPHLDIAANVGFGLARWQPGRRRTRVMDLLESVGLADYAARYPAELSGGEQQRVALARALAPEPHLMLLDEPFSALDTALRADVRGEVLAALREAEVPSLLVTHDPDEAISAGDVVHAMQHGRIIQSATPDELYRNPKSEFVARWFGQVLRFEGRVQDGQARTPIGSVPADAFRDGAAVDVLMRTEAIQFAPDYAGSGAAGRIIDCRRLGPSCNIAVKVEQGPLLTLRKPSTTPHRIGMRIGFEIDQRFAFVLERGHY